MSKEPSNKGTVKPANKRSLARLAAVQALYQMDISGAGVLEVVSEYEIHRLGQNIDGDVYRDADAGWFRSIVIGVVKDQTSLDPAIHTALTSSWPLSRLDSTLRAILRAGTFELSKRKDVPIAVVVSEYVDIANAFYDGDESGIVNAVLDRLARQLREKTEKTPK